MKATIEIPDDLYRQVKAKSALEGRPVREVTVELFEEWVGLGAKADATQRGSRRKGVLLADGEPAPSWFGLARPHMRDVKDEGLGPIRESIGRGWAQEVAESEGAFRKAARRGKR